VTAEKPLALLTCGRRGEELRPAEAFAVGGGHGQLAAGQRAAGQRHKRQRHALPDDSVAGALHLEVATLS